MELRLLCSLFIINSIVLFTLFLSLVLPSSISGTLELFSISVPTSIMLEISCRAFQGASLSGLIFLIAQSCVMPLFSSYSHRALLPFILFLLTIPSVLLPVVHSYFLYFPDGATLEEITLAQTESWRISGILAVSALLMSFVAVYKPWPKPRLNESEFSG